MIGQTAIENLITLGRYDFARKVIDQIEDNEMNEKLYDVLEKLPRKNLINLMWSALDEKSNSSSTVRLVGDSNGCGIL